MPIVPVPVRIGRWVARTECEATHDPHFERNEVPGGFRNGGHVGHEHFEIYRQSPPMAWDRNAPGVETPEPVRVPRMHADLVITDDNNGDQLLSLKVSGRPEVVSQAIMWAVDAVKEQAEK